MLGAHQFFGGSGCAWRAVVASNKPLHCRQSKPQQGAVPALRRARAEATTLRAVRACRAVQVRRALLARKASRVSLRLRARRVRRALALPASLRSVVRIRRATSLLAPRSPRISISAARATTWAAHGSSHCKSRSSAHARRATTLIRASIRRCGIALQGLPARACVVCMACQGAVFAPA
jgi:hypothetical protein